MNKFSNQLDYMITKIRRYFPGFNLIEAAIVLGVIGLIIGGVWVAAATVNLNLKRTETAKIILAAGICMQRTFPNLPSSSVSHYYDYARASIQAGCWPADMDRESNGIYLRGKWNQRMYAYIDSLNSIITPSIVIAGDGVYGTFTASDCAEITYKILGAGRQYLRMYVINGTQYFDKDTVTLSTLQTRCAASDPSVAITFPSR